MRRLTVSLMTILAFSVLSMSAFAANQNDDIGIRGILINPTLVGGDGSGAFQSNQNSDEHYGLAPAWGDREGSVAEGKMENPTLAQGDGRGAFQSDQNSDEHYGLAPAWGDREGRAAEVRMENPTLHGVFENVE